MPYLVDESIRGTTVHKGQDNMARRFIARTTTFEIKKTTQDGAGVYASTRISARVYKPPSTSINSTNLFPL